MFTIRFIQQVTCTVFALILLLLTGTSYALDIEVTKYNDTFDGVCDSDCSLREAVQLANNTPGEDRILLNQGTYSLNILAPVDIDFGVQDEDLNVNGDLDIIDDTNFIGSSSGATIIDAAFNDRALDIISGSTSITHLNIINGLQSEYGGAIENHGTLILRYSALSNNVSSATFAAGIGGGIANWGTLKIYSCEIFNNTSRAGDGGFGRGGGIYNVGSLVVRDTSFRSNGASGDDDVGVGAGIYNKGTADIRRSSFISHSLPYYGYGAAIMNVSNGTLKLVSSTISNSSAGDAGKGAIANGSSFEASGKMYLTNVTIANNKNYGLFTKGDTYIRNSIISGNYRRSDGLSQNCYRVAGVYDAHDVLMGNGENSNCWGSSSIDNDETFITLLNSLSNTGTPTYTHTLKPGSIAIDVSEEGACPDYDQLGQLSNVDGNGDGVAACDLGAIEHYP